jgi:seryl-tRNA synthetase
MKRYNTGPLEKAKQKKTFDNNDPLFKCNKTIYAYINSKLNNIEKKNNSSNKPPKPKSRIQNKIKGNQYTINSSTSTMFSEKSNNKEINFNNDIEISNEQIENIIKKEKILEENEELKEKLKISRNKVSNLEELLQNIIKDSQPLSKEQCPIPTPQIKNYSIPKKGKHERITKYTRTEDGEDIIIKYTQTPEQKRNLESYFGNKFK